MCVAEADGLRMVAVPAAASGSVRPPMAGPPAVPPGPVRGPVLRPLLVLGGAVFVSSLLPASVAPALRGLLAALVAVAGALLLWRRRAPAAALAPADQAFPAHVQAQAARMRAIVDTATEGIIAIDSRGVIDTFNGAAERMFGYPAHEVIGRNVAMLMPSPDRDQHDGYIRRYLQTGEARIIGIGREVVGLRKDGSTFPIDLSVGEGRGEDKRFFTAIVRDITERKEIQAKLSQAERLAAVGELAAGIAHEINNPINAVINCAQLIQDGDAPSEHSRSIIEEGERIAAIVKDLLQFARDDRDHPQPTSVPEVVERTLRLVGENFKRHGIALQVQVAPDLPMVRARPQQLQQVLLNLLINAKDALQHQEPRRDDRRVELRAEAITASPATVRIAVRDNGPGIPPHLGERIFEPFVTTKRARGGTGLGLSISRSIVENYGGRIEVRSVAGEFAEFTVALPQASEPGS
jgi:two-component system sensor kinase FixL